MANSDRLEPKSTLEVQNSPELYKVIDFLNKNLKNKGLIFGVSRKNGKMIVSIYET